MEDESQWCQPQKLIYPRQEEMISPKTEKNHTDMV